MTQRNVEWTSCKGKPLVLVRRALYDVYTLLTVDEFAATEPYVEAVMFITENGTYQLWHHTDGDKESYLIADRGSLVYAFNIPTRLPQEEDVDG